jgi:ubiquinone/menaquinone biosynthesis C-methylase UbiE
LTRYLLSETQGVVYGADIDPDNIAWCKSNLTNGHFETVPLAPPTTFSNQYFDLVIGCSVLTHLTEEMQWAWLSELQRITRPGALLFLSITGPTQFAYNGMSPSLVRMIEEKGFVDLAHDSVLDGVIDDAEYYRSSFHSRQYIVKNWSRYFQVVAIEDAIAAVQDFVILRRR